MTQPLDGAGSDTPPGGVATGDRLVEGRDAPAKTAPDTGRRAGLSRDDVVAGALDLVEREGADALTMRRLAAHLGVTTTTIYWHVGSRDDLVMAVIELAADRQAPVEIEGDCPAERIAWLARRVFDSALTHRRVTSLAHQAGATALLEHGLEVAMAREFEAAGLEGDEVRDALRSVLMCVAGFLVLALQSPERVPDERRIERLWADEPPEGLSPLTTSALATPADPGSLLDRTLAAVIGDHLPPDPPTDPVT